MGVDYAFKADASLKQTYTSNFLLQSDSENKGAVLGTDLEVGTRLTASAPSWSAGGGARFENWFYYGPGTDSDSSSSSSSSSGLNYQNQYLDSHYRYFSERSTWSMAGSYISAAYIYTVADPTLPQGIILGVLQRESQSLAPSWSYRLTEYTKLNLSYQYLRSSYNSTSTGQASYPKSQSHTASLSADHQYNEYLLLNGSLSFTSFLTSSRTINYLNMMTGFNYSPYPTVSIAFNGGGQYTETTSQTAGGLYTQTTNQFGPVFNLAINKQFEHSKLTFNYGRTISPAVNGILFTSDGISLAASRQLSQRLDGSLSVSYLTNAYPQQVGNLQSGSATQQQTTYRFEGGISYTLAQHCILSASYNYILRDLGVKTGSYAGTQDSHNLSVNLNYDFEPLHY